jgi:hypothetical protein
MKPETMSTFTNTLEDIAAMRGRIDDRGERSDRLRLFTALLSRAIEGRPPVAVVGMRAWNYMELLMPTMPSGAWKIDAGDRREMRLALRSEILEPLLADEVDVNDRVAVVEFVAGRETTFERLGRRVILLAYCFAPQLTDTARAAFNGREGRPSLEALGEWFALRARNKRAAPSHAIKKLIDELLTRGAARMHRGTPFVPWHAKSRAAVVEYQRVQLGNQNRVGGEMTKPE